MERIQIVVRASSLHDPDAIKRLERTLVDGIAAAVPVPVHAVEQPVENGLTAVLVLTGGVEREVLKLVSQLPSPTLLLAHPGHNSLPASLEILARIRQDGGEGRVLFGGPEAIAAELDREARIADAWHELRFSRVGLVGEPSEWLVASDVDRAFLKGRLGIEVSHIPIDELIERVARAAPKRSEVRRFARSSSGEIAPSRDDLQQGVAVYEALRSVVEENRLAACTVRCFDLVDRLETTGCYALSRLNDERIPAACEGDMQSLFSLYIGRLLAGTAGFMGNISSVDTARNEILIAHCTCPLSLAAEYMIRTHFESGLGVGIQAKIAEGPCTLFRLGGERLDRLFLREGTIRAVAPREDLCRTQLMVTTEGPVGDLLRAPLGNHHVLLPGHHRETIERFFERHLQS